MSIADDARDRIYLSPPDVGAEERQLVQEAFDSNWIAPLGPHVDAFETEFAERVDTAHAAALSSGTAAIHLALRLCGIGPGDRVAVSTLTFVASANPVLYEGAVPVFVDCELDSWNMDPDLLEEELRASSRTGSVPKAVIVVHLYGQCADLRRIREICETYGVDLIEDAAEALGATYGDRHAGSFGRFGAFSFNGNKIITTSGGGMLVSDDRSDIDHAKMLASQARDSARHYQHSELGYNYRLSNLLAAVGRAQLRSLDEKVLACRENFDHYRRVLQNVPGLELAREAPWGEHTRWLSCLRVNSDEFGISRDEICDRMNERNIEVRPVWKPLHLQPLFKECRVVGGEVSEEIFSDGLCLPSGSSLSASDRERVLSELLSLSV